MSYPNRFIRHTSFRQSENAGLPLNTADLDAEFNDISETMSQVVAWLMGITTADGSLKGLAASTAMALAGAEEFTATALQTDFVTTITWDSSFSALSVFVVVGGSMVDPADVAVADDGSGYLKVTLSVTPSLAGGEAVVITAFSAGAGIATRLASTASASDGANMVGVQDIDNLYAGADVEACLREIRLAFNSHLETFGASAYDSIVATAGQTVFLTAIPWDTAYTTANVQTVVAGTLQASSDISVVDNGGYLQVTLLTATPALDDVVEISVVAMSDILTRDGRGIGGKGMRSNLEMGSDDGTGYLRHRIVELSDAVDDHDAVTLQQLKAYAESSDDMLSVFLRRDGGNAMTDSLDFGGFSGVNLGAPTNNSDAARFADVKTRLALAGTKTSVAEGTLTGPVTLGAAATDTADADQTTDPSTVAVPTVHGVPTPAADDQIANKKYVDDAVGGGLGGGVHVEELLTDGTFTVPAGCTSIAVLAVGGGGGGGYGPTGPDHYGPGGGSGAYALATFAVTVGDVFTITIGTGGLGAAGPGPGTAGGDTTVVASGGRALTAGGGNPGAWSGTAVGAHGTSLVGGETTFIDLGANDGDPIVVGTSAGDGGIIGPKQALIYDPAVGAGGRGYTGGASSPGADGAVWIVY